MLGPIDSEEGAREIDIHALSSALGAIKGPLIIDGHLSHLLNVDAIAILRCEPSVLRTRLEQRSYPTWKVESNIEWELIGGTWAEVEIQNVAEFDSSSKNIDDLWNNIREWIYSGLPRLAPFVDWINDKATALRNLMIWSNPEIRVRVVAIITIQKLMSAYIN